MFFICGINQGQKELSHSQLVVCAGCGGYGRYQVFMTYMCLSLFFIPVLKWGRKYYVKMSCCGAVYELNPKTGGRIAGGEKVDITERDLNLMQAGNRRQWQPGQMSQTGQPGQMGQTGQTEQPGRADQTNRGTRRVCQNCGYETEEDFSFCPKCGGRL